MNLTASWITRVGQQDRRVDSCTIPRMPPLTIRAAAERLGVSYSTFKRWVLNGRVRTTRTDGGHHRVPEPEIERLNARQQPGNKRQQPSSGDTTVGELSARNRLRGFVEEVRVDGLLAQVRLRVGDQRLTAVITADAIAALKLRRGDDALAIIKSTEVMIAKPGEVKKGSRRRGR
jgi:molybdopterin-binding protein